MKKPTVGAIGVMLDDARIPPKLFELDTIYSDGSVDLVSFYPESEVCETHISNFWPLIDDLPR